MGRTDRIDFAEHDVNDQHCNTRRDELQHGACQANGPQESQRLLTCRRQAEDPRSSTVESHPPSLLLRGSNGLCLTKTPQVKARRG